MSLAGMEDMETDQKFDYQDQDTEKVPQDALGMSPSAEVAYSLVQAQMGQGIDEMDKMNQLEEMDLSQSWMGYLA